MRSSLLAVALLALPVTAGAGGAAAAPSSPAPAAWRERPDVFLGYSYTHAGEASLNGWQASGTWPLGAHLRLLAELDGHYGSFAQADLSQATFLVGARWAFGGDRLGPFAEALLGGVRTKTSVSLPGGKLSDSDTDWGGALGGGLDYRFADRFSARAQLDLLLLRADGAWSSDPNVSIGIVYRLGR